MTIVSTIMSALEAQGISSALAFGLLAVLVVLGVAALLWRRGIRGITLSTKKVLNVGVVTSLIEEAISPEIAAAFDGFMRETIEILASRMGRSAVVCTIPADKVEQALLDKRYDCVIVDGNAALTYTSRVELLTCYVSSLTALALIFWDKIPHHMMTLQDYAQYPSNGTAVLKNSLEEHYLSMFDTIPIRRCDTFTRLVVDLKLGLVRAGLVRMEQAKALKNEYAQVRYMPVSLQKQCFVQDERIAVLRSNKELSKELEMYCAMLRREGIIKKIHAKWFANVRPRLPKSTIDPAIMIVDAPTVAPAQVEAHEQIVTPLMEQKPQQKQL